MLKPYKEFKNNIAYKKLTNNISRGLTVLGYPHWLAFLYAIFI